MFIAGGASLILSFLPMLPTQILLNNLLYDASEMTIRPTTSTKSNSNAPPTGTPRSSAVS
jgi:P-type Mg2+ transporter